MTIYWTPEQKKLARKENKYLSHDDLMIFWKYYTVGTGKGYINGVNADTTFEDFCIISALESIDDRRFNR